MKLLVGVALAVLLLLAPVTGAAPDIPARLADEAFWQLVTRTSENGGTFPADNFVSNEAAFQHVVPRLLQRARGGAYVGVGPDQNFTYIVAVRPAIAFIVDVRRQNLLQHLLFKALVEMSPTRADFVSRLFSRPRPMRSAPNDPAAAVLAASAREIPSDALFKTNLHAVLARLSDRHGFSLSDSDRSSIEAIYRMFFRHGSQISYAPASPVLPGPAGTNASIFPTFAELITATDAAGAQHSYLSTEANYAALRDLQSRNLIVPIVGDFSGQLALRNIGRYLRERSTPVTTFYTSNVEQYLFQGQMWRRFYDNVASMPIDPAATFIRAYFPRTGAHRLGPASEPLHALPPHVVASFLTMRIPSVTMLASIPATLEAAEQDRIETYVDVIAMSE